VTDAVGHLLLLQVLATQCGPPPFNVECWTALRREFAFVWKTFTECRSFTVYCV